MRFRPACEHVFLVKSSLMHFAPAVHATTPRSVTPAVNTQQRYQHHHRPTHISLPQDTLQTHDTDQCSKTGPILQTVLGITCPGPSPALPDPYTAPSNPRGPSNLNTTTPSPSSPYMLSRLPRPLMHPCRQSTQTPPPHYPPYPVLISPSLTPLAPFMHALPHARKALASLEPSPPAPPCPHPPQTFTRPLAAPSNNTFPPSVPASTPSPPAPSRPHVPLAHTPVAPFMHAPPHPQYCSALPPPHHQLHPASHSVRSVGWRCSTSMLRLAEGPSGTTPPSTWAICGGRKSRDAQGPGTDMETCSGQEERAQPTPRNPRAEPAAYTDAGSRPCRTNSTPLLPLLCRSAVYPLLPRVDTATSAPPAACCPPARLMQPTDLPTCSSAVQPGRYGSLLAP